MKEQITLDPNTILDRGERVRKEWGDISELAESMKKEQISPILITRNNGNFELVAGGRRRKAAILAGIQIDCIIKESCTDLELKELELEENVRRKNLTWQEENLAIAKLHALKQRIYGVATRNSEGHSTRDTAAIIGKDHSAVVRAVALAKAMEAIPELGNMKSAHDATKILKKLDKKIEVARLVQEHREKESPALKAAEHFIIKDVFEGIKTLQPESFDFANVDTPYGIGLTEVKKTQTGVRTTADYTEWDDYLSMKVENGRPVFYGKAWDIMTGVYAALKPDAFMVWWFGIEWYKELYTALTLAGFTVSKVPGIWYGGKGGAQCNQPETTMATATDTFFLCRKGNPMLKVQGHVNMFECPKIPPQNKIHPTEKPFAMMRELFSLFLVPGMRCIFPLLGSGVDLRTAYSYMCTGEGFELDQNLKNSFLLQVDEDIKNKVYKL